MELTINEKQYVFIFGYRFIKELNKKNEVTERGMILTASARPKDTPFCSITKFLSSSRTNFTPNLK